MASASSVDSAQLAEEAQAPSTAKVIAVGDQAASSTSSAVSYLSLLLFYLPLGFSGLMMTLDLPVVNAVLNRFPNPDTSVAALGWPFRWRSFTKPRISR